MHAKIIQIEHGIATAKILNGVNKDKEIEIPLSRIRPEKPVVGTIIWHVEHHLWDIEYDENFKIK